MIQKELYILRIILDSGKTTYGLLEVKGSEPNQAIQPKGKEFFDNHTDLGVEVAQYISKKFGVLSVQTALEKHIETVEFPFVVPFERTTRDGKVAKYDRPKVMDLLDIYDHMRKEFNNLYLQQEKK